VTESLDEKLSIRGLVAGVIAACIGPVIYYGVFWYIGLDQLVPALIIGPLIGLVVRVNTRSVTRRLATITIILAVCSCIVGFVWVDYGNWKPFILKETIRRLFNLQVIFVIGIAVMIAWWIVSSGIKRSQNES